MVPRQCCAVLATMLVLIISPFGAIVGPHHAATLKSPSTWTIMVYMADDYAPDLPWRDNINQMEAASPSPSTKVIVLVDPLGSNSSMLLQIEHDDGTHGNAIISHSVNDSGAVVPSNGTVNMSSPDTLRSFIRFVATNFSADHLALIMWGHAGGWRGLCPDVGDILTLPEFGQALANATRDIDRPIDVIGIDGCGEANIELLYEIHPYAHYLVASEKNIPDEGFPYTPILNRLAANPGQSPLEFSSGIAQNYIDWSRYNSSISASMSVFDLTRVGDLISNLDTMASIGAKYDSLFHEALNNAFTSAQNYTAPWNADFGDLLGRLLDQPLPPELHSWALSSMLSYLQVRSTFERLELADSLDGEHVQRATGAVIYAPGTGSLDEYAGLRISEGPWFLFGRLARHTGPTNQSSVVPDWRYNYLHGQPVSVSVRWPGQFDSNDATVFSEESGGLSFVTSVSSEGNRTNISAEGYLTISLSAITGSVAHAHSVIRVTLFGETNISLSILENGQQSKRDFDVRIIAKNSTLAYSATAGELRFNLTVPSRVRIGDMIQVLVLDHKSGTVVGSSLAVIGTGDNPVTVEVHHAPQKQMPEIATLLVALLPGLLIILFDLQLFLGDKKSKRKPNR